MRLFDYIRFGLKNLWRQKARTLLTIFAIVIGAVSVIAMLSLVIGAKQVMLSQLEASGALKQVTVSTNTDSTDISQGGGGGNNATGKKLDDALVAQIGAFPHVNDVSPMVGVYPLQAFHFKGEDKVHTLNVSAHPATSANDQQLVAGRNLQPGDSAGVIVLGSDALTHIGYSGDAQSIIGKTLVFEAKGFTGEGATIDVPVQPKPGEPNQPQNNGNQMQDKITEIEAQVVGVVSSSGFGDSESGSISLDWAKGLLTNRNYQTDPAAQDKFNQAMQAWQQTAQGSNHGPVGPQPEQPPMVLVGQSQIEQGGYQSITVRIDTTENVEGVASQIRSLGYGAATAKDFLAQIQKIFNIMGLVFGAIGGISLLVAAIGVINTMVMATLERTREIGVLRACGATRSAVRRLFTFEAALLGFWGGIVGVGIGAILIQVANHFASRLLVDQHLTVSKIVSLPLWLAVSVVAATTVIGMLAGFWPAVRAARLNPVEALRYE